MQRKRIFGGLLIIRHPGKQKIKPHLAYTQLGSNDMNNGFTTTSLACGCEWCESCLRDCWGEDDRGDEVLSLFHAACRALGRNDIYWSPGTSEVIGYAECDSADRGRCYAHTDGGDPSIDLDALREFCTETVGSTDGDVEVEALGDLKKFVTGQPSRA